MGRGFKTSIEIAGEHGISHARVRQWAAQNGLEKVSGFIFYPEDEYAILHRRNNAGRPLSPPKEKKPGNPPGRPRKVKPDIELPKRPVGRPKKEP
jgi:hypothetical protein